MKKILLYFLALSGIFWWLSFALYLKELIQDVKDELKLKADDISDLPPEVREMLS